MRRSEREVTDVDEIIEIIDACKVLRLGINDGDMPYVLPLNFGYEMSKDLKPIIYLHSAQKGRKIQLLKQNNQVCIEMDRMIELTTGQSGCDYSCRFQSLIGWGELEFIEDLELKNHGLQKIMKQQTGRDNFKFEEKVVAITSVMRIKLQKYGAKRH